MKNKVINELYSCMLYFLYTEKMRGGASLHLKFKKKVLFFCTYISLLVYM